jgi:membrane fusion protein (multidrug efflux system)
MRPIIIIVVAIIGLYLLKIFFLDADKNASAPVAGPSAAPAANSAPNALPVDIYVATEVNQSNVVYASGTVVPNEEVEIKAEVSGRLVELNIREGGYIQKGDLIAKLDDADLVAQLKKLTYEEQLADQTEARQKRLLEINAIGKEEYEMAVNKVNTLSADKELLEVQLEKTRVVAPFSGRMGLKSISEGAYITPSTVISNLVQTNPAKLDFSVPEKYASKIKTGQTILFSIDVDDKEIVKEKAIVLAIDPKVDENLRTLKIRARTTNSSGRLLPGMFIRVELPLGDEKSIMIPSESIIPILKGKMVYVKRNGIANEVEIQTGLRTETDVQVEKGLNVGDSLIVSALMSVKANTPVSVRNVVNQ